VKIFSRIASKLNFGAEDPPPNQDASDKIDRNTGLRDAILRGWFNGEAGELFTGFSVGPEDIVADIGCGDGGNAQFCASRGARLILADIDSESVERAASRVAKEPNYAGCETYVTSSDPLPIQTNTATRIVCTEVLEHVDSPDRLMAELARIGRPDARYLLSCPDPRSEEIQKRIAAPSYFEKPNHIRIIQADEFARYVEGAGLVIEGRYSHGFFWNMWWTLFWATDITLEKPEHPVLDNWTRAWQSLLDQPNGKNIKNALDDLLPKSQVIIARKV
jgi:2-polyprenyl-3-methyl-5-hydroxy-6-metoxy-1,4-benzoquinol methylase